jgi:predicted TIM-barrel fold metal-dependent hydrolase
MTQPLGVTGAIVVEASPWLEDNQWILDLAADHPVILGFVGHLECGKPDFRNHLERFHKNPLFRGIRLGGNAIAPGLSQPAFVADLQRLAEADLELDAIGDAAMLPVLVRLTDRVPNLRIVINHMPFDWPKDEQARADAQHALRELGRRPRVYSKVSGVLRRTGNRTSTDLRDYRAALNELWHAFGPDHLVYGSNWPVSDLVAPYPDVLKVVREYFDQKGQEAADKYFWKNSQAAYRWVSRS